MLKALIRWLWPPEASRTQTDAHPDFITREELDAEMKKFQQQTEWMFDEWYEKFSTLHARLEKRANRAKRDGSPELPPAEQTPERVSILAFRRPWSV